MRQRKNRMSPIAPCLSAGLILAVGLMTGCADREAAQKQQAREQYRQALVNLEQAHRGFADADVSLASDMNAYRQEKLAKAAAELQALTSSLTADEQASAKRTLSAIYRSVGRRELTQAIGEWSDWSKRQAGLWEKNAAVSLAEGRADMHDPDIRKASEQLASLRSLQQQQLTGIESESAQLRQAIAQTTSAKAHAIAQRDTLLSQIQKLKSQAFVTQGTQRLEIEKQILALEQQASEREMEARRQEIIAEQKQAELSMLDRRATLARTSIQTSQADMQALAQQSQLAKQAHERALSDESDPTSRINAVKTLESELASLAPGVQAVMEKFQNARQSSEKAVSLASESMSASRDRRYTQSESLAAQVLQIDVMVSELAAQAAMSQTLESMQKLAMAYRLSDSTIQPISQAIASLKDSRQKLSASAKQAVQQADELSKELASTAGQDVSSDPVMALAVQQSKLLQAGRQRLEHLAQP